MPAELPTVFSQHGLGRGPLETFVCLPEQSHLFRRGRLVRTNAQLPEQAKALPASGDREAFPAGVDAATGMTPAEVADLTGKSVETIRRHLRKLERAGLCFSETGHWFRYLINVDGLASHLKVLDTRPHKRQRYKLDRESLYEFLCTPKGRAIFGDRVLREHEGSDIVYRFVDENGVAHELLRRPARPGETQALAREA